jgi:HK97 family phage major capsid protein
MPNAVLQRLVDERERVNETINEVLDRVETEERDQTDAERELIGRNRDRLGELEPQIVELVDLEERRAESRDARAVLQRASEQARPQQPAPDGQPISGPVQPEVVYRTFAEYARDDMIRRFERVANRAGIGAREQAAERIERAVEQVLSSDVPGLLPPNHIAQIMQVIDTQRPMVQRSRKVGLASGKISYPKITARPTVAVQATQKTEVGVGTMTVSMVEKVAQTYLASANMSWQTINWSSPDALALWFDLAAESYAAQTEAAVGTLLATAQQIELTGAVSTVPTLDAWVLALSKAAAAINAQTKKYPDTVVFSPDQGFNLLSLVGATNPTFLTTGTGSLATGSLPPIGGLAAFISNGVGAGKAIVGDFQSLITAETPGAPVELRAVEPSIAGMEVGIVGAFLAEAVELEAFRVLVNLVVVAAEEETP